MNLALEIAELKRKLANVIIECNVAELDESTHRLKVTWGETAEDTITSAWLPWPADIGRNYKRWKPLRMGQPLLIACPSGDTAQARIIAELYNDALPSPSDDPGIDIIQFENGSFVKYKDTGEMEIHASAAMKISAIGKMDITAGGNMKITAPRVDIN